MITTFQSLPQPIKNIIYSILILVVGIVIGLKLGKQTKESSKTTTIYTTIERTDTLKINKPIIVYKDKIKNTTTIKTDSVYVNFKPNDYKYTLDTTNTKFKAHIEGWGGLTNIDIISKHKDSIITNTITNTVMSNKNNTYLWGGYNTRPSYQVGIDYTIKNKVIIGGNIDYDKLNNKVTQSIKIGIKL